MPTDKADVLHQKYPGVGRARRRATRSDLLRRTWDVSQAANWTAVESHCRRSLRCA
jgi:hypothetical protein